MGAAQEQPELEDLQEGVGQAELGELREGVGELQEDSYEQHQLGARVVHLHEPPPRQAGAAHPTVDRHSSSTAPCTGNRIQSCTCKSYGSSHG
ncbi:hypothetical protein A0H81_02470 [Grifola frondosa]|uniref:Uncharacterized protein n=1 Tax=Grifola frondosa TaxID=5627 RepID=A0A1C7MLU8_GRIFR|nr:hypothetical protein A0H81_02470 [Grifola frondosa]